MTTLGQLDVMQVIVGPDIEHHHLVDGTIQAELLGMRLTVCGYDDLVRMKKAAGRPQDLIDLERLRAARGEPD